MRRDTDFVDQIIAIILVVGMAAATSYLLISTALKQIGY